MASASRPWPQASWKSVPPNPLAMTTAMGPEGAGRAPSMVIALPAAARARPAAVGLVDDLEAGALAEALVARLDDPVAVGDHVDHQAHAGAVVAHGAAQVAGHQHPLLGLGVHRHHLAHLVAGRAGRLVGGAQQGGLVGGRHAGRRHGHRVDQAGGRDVAQVHDGVAPARLDAGRHRFGGAQEVGLVDLVGVGVVGRLAAGQADGRPEVATCGRAFQAAVLERQPQRRPVLDVDLGHVAAGAQRAGDRRLEQLLVDLVEGHSAGTVYHRAAAASPARITGQAGRGESVRTRRRRSAGGNGRRRG